MLLIQYLLVSPLLFYLQNEKGSTDVLPKSKRYRLCNPAEEMASSAGFGFGPVGLFYPVEGAGDGLFPLAEVFAAGGVVF